MDAALGSATVEAGGEEQAANATAVNAIQMCLIEALLRRGRLYLRLEPKQASGAGRSNLIVVPVDPVVSAVCAFVNLR